MTALPCSSDDAPVRETDAAKLARVIHVLRGIAYGGHVASDGEMTMSVDATIENGLAFKALVLEVNDAAR